jgi:hypothetical protein
MRNIIRAAVGCCLCGLFALPAAAQAVGGPGSVSYPTLDTTAATGGGASNLGVQYSPATNTLFVSGRGSVVGGVFNLNPPHTLYELDMAGNLLNSYVQPNTTSVWGHRDGATDGLSVFFGDEQGVHCFDPMTGSYQTTPTILANNGPQVAPFPILPPAPLVIIRSLAYNPAGNNGNGSFWTADFGTPLVEFDLNGAVLTSHVNTSAWSLYGLGWDPIRNTLWGNTSPNLGDLVEIDPVTGLETGVRIQRVIPNATQGGCCFVRRPGGGTGGAVPFSEVFVLDQGAPDTLTGYRIDLYDPISSPTRGFYDEIQVQTDVNGQGFSTRPKLFTDGDTISWRYGIGAQGMPLPPLPGILLLAVGPEADVFANTLGIPEMVIPNLLSVPATVGLSFTLGDGFGLGNLIAPAIGIGPNLTTDPAISFPWPVGGPLGPTQSLRLQAFVPDLGIYGPTNPYGGYATNSAVFTYRTPGCDGTDFEGLATTAGTYPTGWSNGPGGTAADQWTPIAGATPSAGTGATSAFSGSTYMYCEASGAANTWPKTFVMDTAALTTCSNPAPSLTFTYHMWGTTVGTLMVEQLDGAGNPTATVFTITGNQGDLWITTTIPVTPIGGTVRLRFTYTTPAANNSWVGDACIDDVFIL